MDTKINMTETVRISISQDIKGKRYTQRSFNENILTSSKSIQPESDFQRLFQSVYDAALITDLNGRISDGNARTTHFLEYGHHELIGMNVIQVISGADASLINTLIENLHRGRFTLIDAYCKRKSGSMFPVEVAVSMFPLSGENRLCFFFRDITMRRKAEDALRGSEEKYRSMFEKMLSAFSLHEMIYDATGNPCDYRFLEVNPAFEKMTGLKAANAIGKTVRELMPTLEPFWIETFGKVAMTGNPIKFEQYAAPLGRYFEGIAYRTESNQFATIFTDITDRKRAEEEKHKLEAQVQHAQKLESLGVLAGGIAHDFNNLLMAILGNADLALSELSPASLARDNIVEIEKASRRAADLCRQMLAYSGKGRFVIEPLSLSAIVEEMSHMLEVSISKKAILKYNFAPNLPAIEADATQIRQVIMNLIINASEAIGDKSGVISISTGAMECDRTYLQESYLDENLPDGVYVYIEVADTGGGMNKETKIRLFEPFFTTKFTGRGLGLAAVLGIVRGHKGAIKVYSEINRGSTFKVLFPSSIQIAGELRKESTEIKSWRGNGTILVVDDEESIRTVSKQMLERVGFKVQSAADGRGALEVYRQNPEAIVCVILDLTMPHMDGEETFRELRRIKPDVRVIMSSGYNEQEVLERFAGKGLAGFIQKPYKSAPLLSKVREVLEATS